MSRSLEFVRWNACVHSLDLSLYSHPKEFLGNGSEPIVTPREKVRGSNAGQVASVEA